MLSIQEIPPLLKELEIIFDENNKQIKSLETARDNPGSLDDKLVARIINSYTKQRADINILIKQCKLLKESVVSLKWLQKITEVERYCNNINKTGDEILSIVNECKEYTIEKILAKDDAELGLDFLMGMLGKKK